MSIRSSQRLLAHAALALVLPGSVLGGFAASSPPDPSDWPQWGGPNRNFTISSAALASSWPSGGPKKLWSRALGEGYSGIVAENGRLYTMYRLPARFWQIGRQDQEIVIALDAATGRTIWEHSYDAPLLDRMNVEYGPGPHSTPLIVGDRIFAIGATGKFHAIDKTTGRVLWSHDLFSEFGVIWGRGYSCSPIAYKGTVIITTGKAGKSVMAFNQADGAIAWQKQNFDYGPSSPILITVEGRAAPAPAGKAGKAGKAAKAKARGRTPESERQEQLVIFMAEEIAGLNPASGELLWRHPHKTDWGLNISTPLWIGGANPRTPQDDNLLFCSSAYNTGSRMLQLTLAAGKTTVEELWFNNRMRIHIGNAVYSNGYVLGSSGDFGPAFLTAVEARTNKEAWRDRTFSRASLILAGDKLIILDEDGTLALATASPERLQILAQAQIFNGRAWTPPTLVGSHLFARDRATILALDLS
ncbi:MAG: PQQ-binding-like beta-propeller repeat protein [Candidatus Acidiferrales bacterium]